MQGIARMTPITHLRFRNTLLGSVAILCAGLPAQAGAQEATSEANEEIVVDPLLIEAERQETATSPVKGYVAGQSATATKTDNPIAETPQSISVVVTKEIEARQAQSIAETLSYAAGIQPDNVGDVKR